MRRLAFTGLVAAFIALTTISCNKTEKFTPISDKAEAAISSTTNTCGTYTVDLIAAQNIKVGTVTVENDAETLFVTYTTTDGWMLECNHLYVGSLKNAPTNGPGNPVIGHFPIHQCFDPMVNTVTYEIPLKTLDSCFIVAAQAEVSQIVDGNIVDSQTAWGAGTPFVDKGNWATYFNYCITPCETAVVTDEAEQTCTETDAIAWADGITFGSGPNCFCTYVSYDGTEKNADIITNLDKQIAGTVYFSALENDSVTIKINLNQENGWQLQDIRYSVKIEGYDSEPTTKPKPYDFTTYKGNETTVTVPFSSFYAVHLNLTQIICE